MNRTGRKGVLCLADGTVLRGHAWGAAGRAAGEVVFNTSNGGYVEILTDPSYAGQIITLTHTQVGNWGLHTQDVESGCPRALGLVVRAVSPAPSSWRAEHGLESWMCGVGLPGLHGVDTRALVSHLRTVGALPGILYSGHPGEEPNVDQLLREARVQPPMHGQEWVGRSTCSSPYGFDEAQPLWPGRVPLIPALPSPHRQPLVVTYDYGVKRNILRLLNEAGFRVQVVPAATSAREVLAMRPDGVCLSNGPGDPAACTSLVNEVRALLGRIPVLGICLGHQLMALAMGARTFKLRFGHRGGNQPVQDLQTGQVRMTSQNHGFAVDPQTVPAHGMVSELNLLDGTVEGLRYPEQQAFSVQYHPEAAPGPHDTRHHFLAFRRLVLGESQLGSKP